MSVYIVDSNFFIQAHRATYPLDVAKSFWNKIKDLSIAGKIVSIDKVRNEIYGNEDALKNWCVDNLPVTFFQPTSSLISEYAQIVQWAMSRTPTYLPNALSVFLDADEADAWLVAHSLADVSNRIIVTHEKSAPLTINNVKIPDACLAHNISFCNTMEMFRQLGEFF